MWGQNDHPPHREGGRRERGDRDKFGGGGGKRLSGGDRWNSRSFFDHDGGMDMTPREGHQPAGEKQVHKDFYNNFGDDVRVASCVLDGDGAVWERGWVERVQEGG